ncbi:hypothetical protein MMC09_004991 [Bachmanniomyces sp. S44760]|nr:hypothetical protein [Bachmanniomyces sp. S44760]
MATSPFASTSCKPGEGTVHLTLLPPDTPVYSTLNYTYPLKLLPSAPHYLSTSAVPALTYPLDSNGSSQGTRGHPLPSPLSSRSPACVPLLFLLTYGGGLLPPDSISLNLHLSSSARLCITTQGSTKIYKSPSPCIAASQSLVAHLSPYAALWLAPDPTQPFKDSWYTQHQSFEVEEGASLGFVDWVSQGRKARGEDWDFGGWKGKNELWSIRTSATNGQTERTLMLRDNVILEGLTPGADATHGQVGLKARMDGMAIFGTIILHGSLFESLGTFFMEEFKALPRIGARDWDDGIKSTASVRSANSTSHQGPTLAEQSLLNRKARLQLEKEARILWTAARVRGLVLVKFGAGELDGARAWLGMILRQEGTVGREFGDGGLMFVR